MKVKFQVDVREAIRRGHNQSGLVELDCDISKWDESDRELLAESLDPADNRARSFKAWGGALVFVTAAAPTEDALRDALRDAKADADRKMAERIATENAEIELTNREDAAALAGRKLRGRRGQWEPDYGAGWRVLIYAKGRESELTVRQSPEWAAWMDEIRRRNAAEQIEDELERVKSERDKAASDRKVLADFLAEVPEDALRGTLKRVAGSNERIDELKERVENASPVQIFCDDEEELDDDSDE